MDTQKEAIGHFEADFTCGNTPDAQAHFLEAAREFSLKLRYLDGGTVFRLPGTCEVTATGTIGTSGWNGADVTFDAATDAPFPFVDQEHPAPAVNPGGDTDPIA